jgi:predicted dehydrogenase
MKPTIGGGRGRRSFLRQVAGTSALLLSHRGLGLAEVLEDETPVGPPVGLGVVGAGAWGREILSTLARMPSARVVAVCDRYAAALKKAAEIAPAAKALGELDALLGLPDVEGVVVATPTHLHKEAVLAALQAGKHVYCEAPLAASVEDARAIAVAALGAKAVFQGGLQGRSNALFRHVGGFVKSGVLGNPVLASARWGRKESWRRVAPTPAREAELNWRLSAATSPGLMGEVAIHQLDLLTQFLGGPPQAVTGFGATALWRDGRDVADTASVVLEYPGGLRAVVQATLASSAGGVHSFIQGTNSSLMVREKRAWLIKEADSPLLGWEVYARKESVLDETGIALVADATKILAAGEEPGQSAAVEPSKEPLRLAFESFFASVRAGAPGACGPREAFQATALALRAEGAVRAGVRLAYSPDGLAPA